MQTLTGFPAIAACLLAITGIAIAAEPPNYLEHQDLTYYLDDAGRKHPIKSAEDWRIRREHILANVERVMGSLPRPRKPVPLDLKEINSRVVGKYTLKKISYHTDSPDNRVSAWLLIPLEVKSPAPAVLCLHQTTPIGKDEPAGLGERENLQYAKHLAERGYVALAPDYPSFGEYTYDFPASAGYASGSMKAIYDNTRAIDVLEQTDGVDVKRIGCIGHSLGGHNAIFTAVFDQRIQAVVSNCGFTRFHKYYDGNLKGWASNRYMPRIASEYGSDPNRVPFDFPELIAAIAPRAFLASSPIRDDNFEVSGVKDCIYSARPIYKLLEAESSLAANYPDCAHDFPEDVRQVAYEFLDKHLK